MQGSSSGGSLRLGPASRRWLISPDAAVTLLKSADGGAAAGLAKPAGSHLLAGSLTASSGADWDRQRPAVAAVAGGGLALQASRHAAAALAAASFATSAASAGAVPDAALFAQQAAARGVVAALLGCDEAEVCGGAALERAVVAYLSTNRRAAKDRDTEACVALELQLTALVAAAAESAAAKSVAAVSANAEPTALLPRLLARGELSRSEARRRRFFLDVH